MTTSLEPYLKSLPVGWQDIIPSLVAFSLICLVLLAVGLAGGRGDEPKVAVDLPEERPDI